MPSGLIFLLIMILLVIVYTIAKVLQYMRLSDRQWREVDKSKLKEWEDDDDWEPRPSVGAQRATGPLRGFPDGLNPGIPGIFDVMLSVGPDRSLPEQSRYPGRRTAGAG